MQHLLNVVEDEVRSQCIKGPSASHCDSHLARLIHGMQVNNLLWMVRARVRQIISDAVIGHFIDCNAQSFPHITVKETLGKF